MSDITTEELVRRIGELEKSVAQLAARLNAPSSPQRDAQATDQQRWMIPPNHIFKQFGNFTISRPVEPNDGLP